MIKNLNIKLVIVFILVLAGLVTIACAVLQPKMHKPFQMNILEYIIKINSDGSIESTKSTTTQSINEVQK